LVGETWRIQFLSLVDKTGPSERRKSGQGLGWGWGRAREGKRRQRGSPVERGKRGDLDGISDNPRGDSESLLAFVLVWTTGSVKLPIHPCLNEVCV
jgi:hypothetical protein